MDAASWNVVWSSEGNVDGGLRSINVGLSASLHLKLQLQVVSTQHRAIKSFNMVVPTNKPYLPISGLANDGWSTETEATATCFCGAVQLAFVNHPLSSTLPPFILQASISRRSLMLSCSQHKVQVSMTSSSATAPTVAKSLRQCRLVISL
jgi:hypothetical protein